MIARSTVLCKSAGRYTDDSHYFEVTVTRTPGPTLFLSILFIGCIPGLAFAQFIETVGSRALGMGGAFVAVANDSSATWWNPAGLAAGSFLDVTLGWAATDIDDSLPARHERTAGFAMAIPPFGISYYRLSITDIGQLHTIAGDMGGREDRRAVVPDWSLTASQLGATLVHTLVSGVHVGTTLKYVRAKGLSGEITGSESASVSEWLELADAMDGGEIHNSFDLDVGFLAVRGPFRMGAVMRNLVESELGVVTIPRQARVGVALDGAELGSAVWMVAADADVMAYTTPFGDRRLVAIGGERWVYERRLGVRAGARFNTAGAEEQAYTAGGSVAVRPGIFVDGHVVFGGTDDESGWGVGARVSF